MKLYNFKSTTKEELLRSGEMAKYQQDWPQAVSIWKEYRRSFPCNPVGHAKGIKALIEWGKLDEAEKVLSETLPRFPDDSDIVMCLGEISMRRYKWSKAIQEWIEFRKKFPKHPTGFICGIISLRQKGKLEEAYKLLSEALEILPSEPGVIAQAGELLMYRKNWHDAISIWEDLRKKFPNHPTGYTRGISALIQAGKEEAAELLLKTALELFPNDIGIAAQTGELAMRCKKWSKAIRIWEDLRKRFSSHPTGYTRGINALILAGKEEAAESLLKKGMELFPHELGITAQAGELAMYRKEWQNAINILEGIRQKFSNHPVGYTAGIEALLQENEYNKAEMVLKTGISKKIDLTNSYKKINKLYIEANDWISSLRLMVNCDYDIQLSNDWRRNLSQALNSQKICMPTFQVSYASFIANSEAIELLIQIRKWINWTREQTLEKLLFFIENCKNLDLAKPSSILSEIICDNNNVYLRGGTLKYTNEDDLLILMQELLKNENYWFETSKDNPVIVDCGTHFGLSLYYFKYLYPNAKIIAFEPNPQLFEIAKKNIWRNHWTNIELRPYAISAKTGTRKFHIPKNDTTMAGSLMKSTGTFGYELETIDVLSVRLSEMIDEPVDFLKLDVEGAELEVFQDIKDKLFSIKNVFCEFHQGRGVESRDLVTVMKLLDRTGFQLRINVSPNFNSHLKYKPMSSIGQKCSSELWGTMVK